MTDNGWLYFKEDKAAHIAPDAFIRQYAKNLGLAEGYHLKPVKDETDATGETKIKTRHQLFLLHYKNVPVEGGEFSLHSVDDVLRVAHGRIVAGLDIDVSKPIDTKIARQTALSEQKLTAENFGKQELPEGELVLTRTDGNFLKESFRLAYSFELKGEKIAEPYNVLVDAQTGKVLKKIPLSNNCFGSASQHISPLRKNQPTEGMRINAPLVASTFVPNHARYNNAAGGLTFETEQVGSQYRLSAFGNNLNTRIAHVVTNNGQLIIDWNLYPDVRILQQTGLITTRTQLPPIG